MKKTMSLLFALALVGACVPQAVRDACVADCKPDKVAQYPGPSSACQCDEPAIKAICRECTKTCAPRLVAECSGNSAFQTDVCKCEPR